MPDGETLYANWDAQNPRSSNLVAINSLFLLIDDAVAADEGEFVLYAPHSRGSLEVTGSGTFSLQLYGTNQENQPTRVSTAVTVTGTATPADVLELTFTSTGLPGGSVVLDYTVSNTDTLTTIAAAFAALINGNAALTAASFFATSSSVVLTTTQTGSDEIVVITDTSAGSPGETLTPVQTFAPVTGETLGSAITSTGITIIDYPVRWLRAQLTSISGGGANITARLNALNPS